MAEIKLDIGNEFSRGWKLFQANMGLLILAGLIGGILSLVTCGVLSGPMLAGLLIIIRRLQKNDPEKPEAGDIFRGFDYFLQSFLFVFLFSLVSIFITLVVYMVPILGQLAGLVISLATGSLILWGVTFVAYQKMQAIDVFKKLINGVTSGTFIMPLVFGLLVSLLSSAGAIACGIGVLFTYPLACCCLVSAYETLFDGCDVEASTSVEPPEPTAGTQG